MTTLTVIAVLFIAIALRLYIPNNTVPALGVVDGLLKPLGKKPNNVSTITTFEPKKVVALATKDTTEATMSALIATVKAYGSVKIVEQTDTYLRVEFITGLMKFKDDAEFLIDEENKIVHFRSSSRAGTSDLGLNRKRYEALSEFYSNK